MSPPTAYVSLGSNLGDREAHLASALEQLDESPGIRVLATSRLYETDPVGPAPQGAYLNAVTALDTDLEPRALLARLHEVEVLHGRVRGAERNLPRTLDLDVLLYAERCIREAGLEVPHPRLAERPFVLEPLAELAPDLVHPGLGESVAKLAARVRDPKAVRLFDEEEE